MANLSLELDAFIRSIGVNRASPHALFLGAGASMSSGVPSAGACIWEWKRSIFCTNNPGLEDQVSEISLPAVRERIDRWLIVNGIVSDDDEYSFYIEKCLPIADDRRRFFEPWVRKARPHVGYRMLCLLAEEELFRSVWTTNFDGLVARAAAEFDLTPIEVGIESGQRVFRQPERNELVCVSLHGDYRYDPLKNTTEELQEQDEHLRAALVEVLQTHSLLVSGYSGRDASVMKALREGVSTGRATKVYWCGLSDEPEGTVAEFLTGARDAGHEAYYVPGAAFDDVMARLVLHCLTGERLRKGRELLGELKGREPLPREPFSVPANPPTAIIKSNAWRVQLPTEMYEIQLQQWPEKQVWKWLKERTSKSDVVAVPFRHVLAFGTLDGIKETFAGVVQGEIRRVPITQSDVRYEDGAVVKLLRQALVRAIAAKRGLESDGDRLLWKCDASSVQREAGRVFDVHEAVHLSLRRVGESMYVAIDPTVYVPGEASDVEAIRNIRARMLGYQHNKEFNAALEDWRKTLFSGDGPVEFDYPPATAAFQFKVSKTPAFAGIHQPRRPPVRLNERYRPLVSYRGIEVQEPRLRFSGNQEDVLPLRGLALKGPFDQKLRLTPGDDSVNVAVICPRAEAPLLETFLAGCGRTHVPQRGEKEEYLVRYDGFETVFRTRLSLPRRNDSSWYTLPEPSEGLDSRGGSLELSRRIREGLDSLASIGRAVVLIFVPERWRAWRGFKSDGENFDVHDFVKAYSVQRGIATQFLEQDTLSYPDKCRIWWWLSVALYAKAMRTPWVLDGLDAETAFVGIGFSIDKKKADGGHIVLGCSHLYNAHGQGLQFRLSRIENPVIRGDNPFMSFEDARRLGETIRTLFWEAHLKLPSRVVIHKLTPFLADEQRGLRAGLEDIRELEMVEINFESALRFISSQQKGDQFEGAGFPVRRGTAVKLTDHEALLWVHGSADAAKANWTYYQGKRRIPGPVVLRRYAGNSDLATLSNEILGLSKMDWNSGDLYGKLPATVSSSRRIARIGSLLERFSATSYDYRLFM